MAAGAEEAEAVDLANHAAGIVIREVGTAAVTPEAILRSFRDGERPGTGAAHAPYAPPRRSGAVRAGAERERRRSGPAGPPEAALPRTEPLGWDRAAAWARELRAAGRRLVFTNGCFDLLHPGHIHLLQAAAAEGDALVVGLNGDASVRRLKGPDRPVLSELERARQLLALPWVDAVVLFEHDTPLELITRLEPDVLVKGGDYHQADVVGAQQVEGWGGRVVLVPFLAGHGTTGLVEALRRRGARLDGS
ncbi:MAG: D-glycero-beta-D-manno-heptose 1-phosphate adenylyltransferase [Candidatus Eisenbacteria bacterium]|nr:D-glycero-beta-D-manno-heptose 1-phosphate adenylyltransferase [Candidatus Eisenbacteria bacterium]